MAKLDEIFSGGMPEPDHPLLRYISEDQVESVTVEVVRPKDVLGHKPAKLFVTVTIEGTPQSPKEYSWDDDLNIELIERGYQAPSAENEKLRFSLALRAKFRRIEMRYGEGFFNSVLVVAIRETPLSEFDEVSDVMKDVSANPPYRQGSSYSDCLASIVQVFHSCAQQLTTALKYGRDEAEAILAGAVARYLDDRFTVTDRRRLGWT